MNPVVIIPTYWAQTDTSGSFIRSSVYDFTTPITTPLPELEVCLESLEQVRGMLRVIVLVVASPSCATSARARVNAICRAHADLNPLVIGGEESDTVRRAIATVAPQLEGETVSLRGYGAIKNMGLAVASIFGHDTAVFLDDDAVVLDDNYLIDAVYGLGTKTKQSQLIAAKTGYLLNRAGNDSPFAQTKRVRWADKLWSRSAGYNLVMKKAISLARISASNIMIGGCCALHAEAYMRVPFDPFITRGEDFDYLLNMRARGMHVWMDNEWCVRSQPPVVTSEPQRFLQDAYRWCYESRKLEKSNASRRLHKVTPESLAPYPGPWISDDVRSRISGTALRRFIAGPDRGEYLRIFLSGRHEADRWAESVAARYLPFAAAWPHLMAALWDQKALRARLLRTGTATNRMGFAAR